jgi:hypothetical protein
MREHRLVVTAVTADTMSFTFGGHEYRASVKGRHTCSAAPPIAIQDRLTIAHRGPTGDVLVVAVCGCPFFVYGVTRRREDVG